MALPVGVPPLRMQHVQQVWHWRKRQNMAGAIWMECSASTAIARKQCVAPSFSDGGRIVLILITKERGVIMDVYHFQPIGYVHSPFKDAMHAPKFYTESGDTEAVLDILPAYRDALLGVARGMDLMKFERLIRSLLEAKQEAGICYGKEARARSDGECWFGRGKSREKS